MSPDVISKRSPLNRVKNRDFISAVEKIVAMHDKDPIAFEKESVDLIDMVNTATRSSRKVYLNSIVEALRNLRNHKFEDIISELFKKMATQLQIRTGMTVREEM